MLKIEHLSAHYGEKQVLNDFNLQCEQGTIHGILGRNGAGKTTFFKCLYGLRARSGGLLSFDSQPIENGMIAYLETHNYFYPFLKGREYLELTTLQNKGFDIDAWNKFFDLPLEELAENYSTGMKKKLALLGTIGQQRPILLLDEPFNGVDFETVETIYIILDHLRKQGKTILLTSHVLPTLTEVCDHISWLKAGQIETSFEKTGFEDLKTKIKAEFQQGMENVLAQL